MDFPRISPYFDHDAFMHHPMHVLDASEFCCPTQSARSSRSLRSADQGLLRVPFARISTRQKRSFAVAGPSIWNDLPLSIGSLPRTLSQTLLSQLKAVPFGRVGVGSASV